MQPHQLLEKLSRFAPGIPALLHYQRSDFRHNLLAGLSVAAVALPIGVAYAQLAGLSLASGLYASILPLLACAIFSRSRQLIVVLDSAIFAPITATTRSVLIVLQRCAKPCAPTNRCSRRRPSQKATPKISHKPKSPLDGG